MKPTRRCESSGEALCPGGVVTLSSSSRRRVLKKTCITCKIEKVLTEYSYDKGNRDGRQSDCTECACIRRRKYENTPQGKEKKKQRARRYPERVNARVRVGVAIQRGKLSKPSIYLCHNVQCQKRAQEYHHWHGYEREYWLDVIPLCKSCHIKKHLNILAGLCFAFLSSKRRRPRIFKD